jgi:Tol biopolymer transport system component
VFSPDGRWLAFSSDETGQSEIYIVSFPGLGAKQQVSRDGGHMPRWSATGNEVFFLEPIERGNRVMSPRG